MRKKLLAVLAASLIAFGSSGVEAAKPIVIQEQGSFTVGGTYKERSGKFSQENFVAEDGQRAYGDFAYVEYQIPVKAKKLPLIFQHGGAQLSARIKSERLSLMNLAALRLFFRKRRCQKLPTHVSKHCPRPQSAFR